MKIRMLHKAGASVAAAATVVLVVAPSALATGPSLETFVMATNGESNYNTYRQPDDVYNTFGGSGVAIPFNATIDPSLLASDGILGTYRQTDATTGTLTDALSSSGSGRSGFGGWTYSGSTSVSAQSGILKSVSQATQNGNADNGTINSAESYGIMQEGLTASDPLIPDGTGGYHYHIAVTIDGSFSITGEGTAGMLLRYGYDGVPIGNNSGRSLLESFVDIYGNGYQVYGPNGYFGNQTPPPGYAFNVGPLNSAGSPAFVTFGGTTTAYMDIPMSFGSSATIEMAMMTFIGVDNATGVMNSSFGHTASISGIQIFDGSGNEVKGFTLTSASGTLYDANGVHSNASAPEPDALILLASGIVSTVIGTRVSTATLSRRRRVLP